MKGEKEASPPAKLTDSLNENTTDLIAALTSGALGSLPIIGPVVAQMFTFAIPGQRTERIVDVLYKFESRIEDIEEVVKKMNTPAGVDLTEDALVQASRALTEDRRLYIANLLRNSLTKEEIEHDQKKKLFILLNQLTDSEIIYLKYYSMSIGSQDKHPFNVKHQEVLDPIRTRLAGKKDEGRSGAFRDNYIATLDSLGLVMMETQRVSDRRPIGLTALGSLLLNYIEVSDGTEEHE